MFQSHRTLIHRLHRGVARIATAALLLLTAAGCNEEGVFRPSVDLDFSLVSSSATEAEIGQNIEIEWQYNDASKMRAQSVKLIRLSMEMEAQVQAARLLTWRAAWMIDQGIKNNLEASMCKAKAGLVVTWVTQKAVELLGPLGYSRSMATLRGHKFAKKDDKVEKIEIFYLERELVVKRRSHYTG